ncbi:hypothetical protein KI387_020875 [Taxus chinensis]|uniref:Fungal lipase-type domain-containing protein n=1 Tax=Taxus chinensis TaxID=29808 RepID=A0AA38G9N5_TAXCH|nr:hypothetical protein KI387_020875 [Taxus chinensis]
MATPLMADPDGIDVTGLSHLVDPNWEDQTDRRCIAAVLVEVVYQHQINDKRVDQWSTLLPFKVKEEIIIKDEQGKSIVIGVIFGWVGRSKLASGCAGKPPSEVVAFRGTLWKSEFRWGDFCEDVNVALARMDSLSRVGMALKYLRRSIQRHGSHNIWIVGHSLGASIALAAVRNLSREEREKLEAHLFNPPFISPRLPELKFFEIVGRLLSTIRNGSLSLPFPRLEGIYKGIQGACDVVALRMGLQDDNRLLELYGEFIAVGNWIPNLYVNKKDLVCSTYIKYLEAWKGIYTHNSDLVHETMKHLFCFEVANKRTPWHMVPSAKLFVAITDNKHHSLCQWWLKDLQIQSIHDYVPPKKIIQWNANTVKTNLP